MSKYHLINIYTKENSNTDCVVNVRSVEISNELGQSLPGLQICLNFARDSESESLAGRSKRSSSKVDFHVIRDPKVQELKNRWASKTMRKIFASSTLSYRSCILYQCLEIILTNYDQLLKK